MAEVILSVRDLEVNFGPQRVLSGISFDLNEAETVGLIGPNGSGKTTIFNCLNGFVPILKGKICFKGEDISTLLPDQRAALGIGRVFQDSGIFKELTLIENLLLALESKDGILRSLVPFGKRIRSRTELVDAELERINLHSKRFERAGNLSGGQLRLLEISRAILSGAKLLLLDEPTAGVAPAMKELVSQSIMRLGELGCTVVVIEHDLGFIEKFAARILVINQGQVALDGTPEKVRGDPRLQEIYFG